MAACLATCFFDTLKTRPFWVLVLFTLGSMLLLKSSFVFLKWVWDNFLRPDKNLKIYGSWALVTGPTDGIGKGFAFQLAWKWLNLVLVGRNPDKITDVADSIFAKYGKNQIKIVVVDFTGDHDEGVKKIKEAIEGPDIIRTKGRSFAYVDVLTSSSNSFSKLFSTYNGCAWKRSELKLEKAKDYFLTHLKREWTEGFAKIKGKKNMAMVGAQAFMMAAYKSKQKVKKWRCPISQYLDT